MRDRNMHPNFIIVWINSIAGEDIIDDYEVIWYEDGPNSGVET